MPGGNLSHADWLTRIPPAEDAWFGTVERERARAPTMTGGSPRPRRPPRAAALAQNPGDDGNRQRPPQRAAGSESASRPTASA